MLRSVGLSSLGLGEPGLDDHKRSDKLHQVDNVDQNGEYNSMKVT